jgi:hypothetical protein
MTRTRWGALAIGLGLGLGACGSDDDGGGGGPDGGGSGGSAVQLLTFTGPISGSMTEAKAVCEKFASAPPRLVVTLNGKVGATDRVLRIIIDNYAGPGNYGGSAVKVGIDSLTSTVTGDEASVAAGEKSGTVDSATSPEGNEVSGSWSCAAAPVAR